MLETRLYLAQRLSAVIIAPLVMIHLGVDTDEILARTSGSLLWAASYGLFAIAVAIHAAIGLRNIFREWLKLRGVLLNLASLLVFAGLLVTGLRAVYGVTAA
jgi:fumarate reductase subunit C